MSNEIEFFDNTKVSGYRSCPRRFFFRHKLHLVPEGTSPDLGFGLAWHSAMDVAWRMVGFEGAGHGDVGDVVKAAFKEGFHHTWHDEWDFPSITEWTDDHDDRYSPRTPFTAISMLENYCAELPSLLSRFDLIAIERPFAVPLDPQDPTLWYCGRLDKVLRSDRGLYQIWDHKTTSQYKKDGYFRPTWVDSFQPDSQMEGYAFEGLFRYKDDFQGVYVDGALVHKTVHEGFIQLPVLMASDLDAMDQWLWETKNWIWRIKEDTQRMLLADSETHMSAFPRNTGACMDYGRACPYLDACRTVGNPLKEFQEHGPDMGFKIEPWEPFEINKLDEIGLRKDGTIAGD